MRLGRNESELLLKLSEDRSVLDGVDFFSLGSNDVAGFGSEDNGKRSGSGEKLLLEEL